MASDCVFCKIVRGELPSFKVYEDDKTFAFLDIHHVNAGHTLVVPKQHATNIFDIEPADWTAVSSTARIIAIAVDKALNADGVNIAMNNREHAGQSAFHPHIHVIPRFKDDGLKLMPQRQYAVDEAEATLERIRAVL